MNNRINICSTEKFNKLLFDFKDIKFDRNTYKLSNGYANCVAFITFIFSEFSYLCEFDKMKINDVCFLEKKEVPDNFTIVLFMETTDEVYQHTGLYFEGKVYSMGLKGIQSTNINLLKKMYKELRFFDIIRIKKEDINE